MGEGTLPFGVDLQQVRHLVEFASHEALVVGRRLDATHHNVWLIPAVVLYHVGLGRCVPRRVVGGALRRLLTELYTETRNTKQSVNVLIWRSLITSETGFIVHSYKPWCKHFHKSPLNKTQLNTDSSLKANLFLDTGPFQRHDLPTQWDHIIAQHLQ